MNLKFWWGSITTLILAVMFGVVFGLVGSLIVFGIGQVITSLLARERWGVAMTTLLFVPMWVATTHLFTQPAMSAAGGVTSVLIPLAVAYGYTKSAHKGRYHVCAIALCLAYLSGAAGYVTGWIEQIRQAVAPEKESLAEEVRKETDELRELNDAFTDYQEVYAQAANWPPVQLTSDRSPIFEASGVWGWERIYPWTKEDQYRGKVIMEVVTHDGKRLRFHPKQHIEFKPVLHDDGTPVWWDYGTKINANFDICVKLPGSPTTFVPASQRAPNGLLYRAWVYSCDVRQKPTLPPAPWSANMVGSGEAIPKMVDGRPADVIAIHRVALQAGQVSDQLNYFPPAVTPEEQGKYSWHWRLHAVDDCTIRTTVNGQVRVWPKGIRHDPANLWRAPVTRGDFKIAVELPQTDVPATTVEFLYFRTERA